MKNITLSVQPFGNSKYRLGIKLDDSRTYFVKRHREVILKIEDQTINTKTTCGPPLNKGFDLSETAIHQWIIDNSFHKYIPRKPTKLIFKLDINNGLITLTYLNKE
ncbi:hypothetical protein [Flavobacterium inviolabile]|uniref:hypothetical protein n=1 Tax=Flavobacterium inviolabile TaxID=2748320 RepID=UPI0015B27A86|nr:hypothetical protein [Flavobacterium inviolabile]